MRKNYNIAWRGVRDLPYFRQFEINFSEYQLWEKESVLVIIQTGLNILLFR